MGQRFLGAPRGTFETEINNTTGPDFHPPSQEATAARPSEPELLRRSRLKPWRNAERVPAEALAKAGSFGGFRRSQVGATAVKPWGSTGVLPHGISVRTER